MIPTSTLRVLCLSVIQAALVVSGGRGTPPAVEAQAKPEFKLKLMGINRTLDPWKLFEEWARTVEQRTNGRVQFELTSLPELGFGGAETCASSVPASSTSQRSTADTWRASFRSSRF